MVQVADAIGDHSADEWIQLAAKSLLSIAVGKPNSRLSKEASDCGTTLCNAHGSNTAETTLLALPHHIQREILSAALAQGFTCVHTMLEWLPKTLHVAIVDAAIQIPHQTLKARIGHSHNPLPFFNALTTLPTSPPSITSLYLYFEDFDMTPPSTRTATHLAKALRHHSMLSTLSISMLTDAAAAKVLCPAISSLSHLHSLYLGGRDTCYTSCSADVIPALRSTFNSLPHLSCLHISLNTSPELPTRKRRRDSYMPDAPPQSQYCLAAMLSAASGLTSLSMCLQPMAWTSRVAPMIVSDGATASLRHLRHLVLKSENCTTAARLLHSLHACPVTSLVLNQSNWGGLGHFPDRASIAESLCTFSEVRSMHINDSTRETWVSRAFCSALRDTPAALTGLRGISELNIDVDLWTLHLVVPQLAAAMPSLQQLTIDCDCLCARQQSLWVKVLEHLGRLQLQCLDLSVCGRDDHPGPQLPSLGSLTCLTALRLEGYDLHVVRIEADLEALSKMTQLRGLHLNDFDLPDSGELDTSLVPALLPLRRLTRLVVSGDGVHEALVAACQAQQLCGAWPELRHLGMSLYRRHPKAEVLLVIQGLCGLPALQQIVYVLNERRSYSGGPESYDIDIDDGSEPCEGDFKVPVSLQAAADAAGVDLVISRTWIDAGL